MFGVGGKARLRGVQPLLQAVFVQPHKALLDPTVGQVQAHVQGESLKARATPPSPPVLRFIGRRGFYIETSGQSWLLASKLLFHSVPAFYRIITSRNAEVF